MTAPAAGPELLFRGAPHQHLARRLGLAAAPIPGPARGAALWVLTGWAPLALLAVAQDGGGGFAGDYAVHARSLLAVPLLALAEASCAPRLDAIVRHFLDAGLVADHHRPRFDAALASTRRAIESLPANAVLLALAFATSVGILLAVPAAEFPAWHLAAQGAAGRSLAGWWHALVSLPLLLLLTLGWLWRLWLWARLLRLVARLDLRLVPSHPDRCAGLRFVGYSLRAFALVAFALGVVAAGRSANALAHLGMTPFAHRDAILAGAAIVVALLVAPLFAFSPRLLREWRRGIFEYGALADRLGRDLEARWLGNGPAAGGDGLESPHFSTLADVYHVVGNVYGMRFVPVDLKSVVLLLGAVLLPFLPLALVSLPLDAVLRALARAFT